MEDRRLLSVAAILSVLVFNSALAGTAGGATLTLTDRKPGRARNTAGARTGRIGHESF